MSVQCRFGIIGTGGIAHRFMAGVPHVPEAIVTTVFNRTQARAELFAEQYGLSVSSSLEELLESDIDAVYIATPHLTHADLSIAALKAGKAVLCEKPAAVTLEELESVIAVASEQKCLYMEAMKPAFFPLYKDIRDRVNAGAIGDVQFVRAGFSSNTTAEDAPLLHDPLQAGGGLFDVGIYAAFFAVDWLGPVSQLQACGRIGSSKVDTFATFQGKHASGQSQLFCGLDTVGPGDAIIAGTSGYIQIHEKWWSPTRATLVNEFGEKTELVGEYCGSGLNYELAHFCKLWFSGMRESPILTHAKTYAALSMVKQAHDCIMKNEN